MGRAVDEETNDEIQNGLGIEGDEDDALIAELMGEESPASKTTSQADANKGAEDQQASTSTGKSEQVEANDKGDEAGKPKDRANESDDQHGDGQPTKANPHKALRAARRSEERARREAEQAKAEAVRLAKELEQLRTKVPAESDPDAISDQELAELERDMPHVAKALKEIRKKSASAQGEPAKAAATGTQPADNKAPEDDFIPVQFTPEVQDAVDEVPDLLDWQHDPDQSMFQRAIAMDGYLQNLAAWKDKPMADRFAEVVRRVKAEDAASSQEATTQQPAAKPSATKALPEVKPIKTQSLSDIGGASTGDRGNDAMSLKRMQQMSDDELFSRLRDMD